MIFVEPPVPDPADALHALAKPFPKTGKSELDLARKYYAKKNRPPKAYEFKRYKEFEVCTALDALFHEKCAYCESTYRAVGARDIEHFRPKAAVMEAPGHPGYWWLAAAWSNLLPSCPDCNRLRGQLVYDSGMSLEEFDRARLKEPEGTSGKANSFPVRNNHWIADENGDLTTEDPLLINPMRREPEKHIEWVFDWNRTDFLWEADPVIASVRPREQNGVEDPYGKASIAIYGLNRAGLFRERMSRITEIQLVCQPLVDAIVDLQQAKTQVQVDTINARLTKYRKNLREFTKPAKTYAGMARAFIAAFDVDITRLAATPPP